MIRVAALTSYSTAPLHVKIRELVRRGINVIDLYCFCPSDLPTLYGTTTWPGAILEYLRDPPNVAKRIAHVCRRAEKEAPRKPVDICGLATYLPDISLPGSSGSDKRNRENTLRVLERLLELLAELRRYDFSCRTFQLVAGHIIVRPEEDPKANPPRLRCVERDACYEALANSLARLTQTAAGMFPTDSRDAQSRSPLFALEIEPGASKLLRLDSEESRRELVTLIQRFPNVGLNLDIGHMLILKVNPQDIFRPELGSRIVHVHISDNADSHFADLSVGSYHGDRVFADWLRALVDHSRRCRGLFQGCVSIEMEACGSADEVHKAYLETKRLLKRCPVK
jgi:sugar phosphate isomerase/epimerase